MRGSRGIDPEALDAVVLCGGLGTRLRSVSDGLQKTMIAVGGAPFLELLIEWAAGQGLRRFILCTGFESRQVSDYFEKNSKGLDISFSREEKPLGTAGALRNCSGLLRGGPLLLLNGDSLCPLDLKPMLDFHLGRRAVATVAVVSAGDRKDGGFIETGGDGRIVSFSEKAPGPGRVLNAGVYLLERAVLGAIPAEGAASLEREVFPALIKEGVYAHRCAQPLYDIGTPERLEAFRRERAAALL